MEHNITENIKENVKHHHKKFMDIQVYFPKSNKIDLKAFDEKQKTIMKNIIPENLQKEIEANYNKFITLKDDFK